MKLESITLENFRQYYGNQHMKFSKETDKCVTVIHGVNGAGKTSLFLALNWCLYGKITGIDAIGELVSKEAIQRAHAGETVRASVQVEFWHEAKRFRVRRALTGKKDDENEFHLDFQDELTMMRTGVDGQAKTVNNPENTMNVIMPTNVREYFLFDGEKIDDFAKPEASKEIKEAIFLVLKLEVLERASRHLKSIAKEYTKNYKDNTEGELRDLLECKQQEEEEKEKKEQRKEELEEEIKALRRHVDDISKKLHDSQAARGLQEKRDLFEQNRIDKGNELSKIMTEWRDITTASYPAFALPAVETALEILDAARESGQIPSNVRQQFVEDLLENMICICGRPIKEESDEHQCLIDLIEKSVSTQLENDVMETAAALKLIPERVESNRKALEAVHVKRVALTNELNGLNEKLDEVHSQLKGSPLEEISRLEKSREDKRVNISNLTMEIGSLNQGIKNHDTKLKQFEVRIKKAEKSEQKVKLISTQRDLALKSSALIAEIYGILADEYRKSIEAKTKQIFSQLAWKDGHFQDVRLDEDFNLEVIDRYGKAMKAELSAGERQVLSLSFITAMSRISEEEAPIVMDTPFGRLSEDHRNAITKHLPDLADQLVLFVTDTELVGDAKQNISPRVGAEYKLDFNTQSGCTTIRELV